MIFETAFTMDTSSIKFGPGVTREVGHDMQQLGVKRVMVVTDPNLANSQPVAGTLAALLAVGIDAVLFDQARVEPTDASLRRSALPQVSLTIRVVGGGSSMDAAKARHAPLRRILAYVNPPIGEGVGAAISAMIAIPTTAGTGSETTGVAISFLRCAKTGIPIVRDGDGIIIRQHPPREMIAACTS
jgi:hydroxyacid-oxoacid transhydrogenase